MVVFKIFSKVSGQFYVGSCRGNIDERWELYLRAAEAGLDFPLYKEIREHGETQFAIDELDFADDISELKEMELLHTIELSARSLRNYKFGRTDAVVKRIRQVEHERAWMKDLPEESVRTKVSRQPVVKSVGKTVVSDSVAPTRTNAVKSAANKVVRNPAKMDTTVVSQSKPKPKPLASKSFPQPVSVTVTAPDKSEERASVLPTTPCQINSKAPQTAAADVSVDLDKALFAEGIGLLVRAVTSVEQFSSYQQHAKLEAQLQARALAESERALQQLQLRQDEAAIKAQQAMEAVAAAQVANGALRDAQRQARERSTAVLTALDGCGDMSEQAAQLQREFSRLLMRIKAGVSPRSAETATVNPSVNTASIAVSADAASKTDIEPSVPVELTRGGSHVDSVNTHTTVPVGSEPEALLTQAKSLSAIALETPVSDQQQKIVEAQEAKMVNQLKQLGTMLSKDPLVSTANVESVLKASSQSSQVSPLDVKSPARAWIATSGDDAESALVLLSKSIPTTIVHRRPKVTQALPGSIAAIGRKTLSIKSR